MRIRLPANDWRPRDYQMPAWSSWEQGCKRQLLFWHRRAGKDELNLHQHAIAAHTRVGTYWHMLPEYSQARKAIWNAVNPHSGRRRIDEAFPPELIENRNDNEMFIRFKSGSTWQVVGSDNFNNLVGTPPVGLTFSEWALANPTAWAYLSPILAENGGWASFITTPRGNNHAKKMYDAMKGREGWFCEVLGADVTGAISEEAIEEQRTTYKALFGAEVADLLIDQEFYCSFAGAMVGSYFGSLIDKAEREGRIGEVGLVDRLPVHTAWDLGVGDDTAIWCFQAVEGRIRLVDYYASNGVGAEHYVEWLRQRGYAGFDYLPHDAKVTEWGSGRTRVETLQAMGRKVRKVPAVSFQDGINAVRLTLPLCEFDAKRCEAGIDALRSYRREWDDDNKVFKDRPLHDWTSHPADAFRYLALSWRAEVKPQPAPQLWKPRNGVLLPGIPKPKSSLRIRI
jgi:hypothetical protein